MLDENKIRISAKKKKRREVKDRLVEIEKNAEGQAIEVAY